MQHAKHFNAKVYLVTSLVGGSKDNAEENRNAESNLEFGKSLLEKEGLECETRLMIRGLQSGEDLVKFANDNEIDEIQRLHFESHLSEVPSISRRVKNLFTSKFVVGIFSLSE